MHKSGKLNRQVYSVQLQISAKFHPDRWTFGIIAPKNLFTAHRGCPLPRAHGHQLLCLRPHRAEALSDAFV